MSYDVRLWLTMGFIIITALLVRGAILAPNPRVRAYRLAWATILALGLLVDVHP